MSTREKVRQLIQNYPELISMLRKFVELQDQRGDWAPISEDDLLQAGISREAIETFRHYGIITRTGYG